MPRNLRKLRENYTYQKEPLGYIPGRINRIRNSVEDRQSQLAWPTVNEVNGRKSTSRAKLKAANQEERLHNWKEHVKNLLRNSLDKTIKEITNSQLDIKLGQFRDE